VTEDIPPDQKDGGIGIFGADFGVLLSIADAAKTKGIQIPAAELIKEYYQGIEAVRGGDTKIYYHTDDSGHGLGCGHATKASSEEFQGKYGSLEPWEVKEFGTWFVKSPFAKALFLEGDHKEEGVLIVEY